MEKKYVFYWVCPNCEPVSHAHKPTQAIPAIPSKKIVTPKHLRTPLPRVNVHCGKTLRIPGKHRCLWNIEI